MLHFDGFRFVLFLCVGSAATAASAGEIPVFRDGFEWGDTGDWSATVPPRCDVISPFDRGLAPSSEIHVAPPPAGSDANGDGSPASPYATLAHAAGFGWDATVDRVLEVYARAIEDRSRAAGAEEGRA